MPITYPPEMLPKEEDADVIVQCEMCHTMSPIDDMMSHGAAFVCAACYALPVIYRFSNL
ncbi:MAG: hypothetical protein IPL32_18775 [Chloracidobacterium sp.]|nr:hypothetical protein [Chloracidobacterium sp.]